MYVDIDSPRRARFDRMRIIPCGQDLTQLSLVERRCLERPRKRGVISNETLQIILKAVQFRCELELYCRIVRRKVIQKRKAWSCFAQPDDFGGQQRHFLGKAADEVACRKILVVSKRALHSIIFHI